MTEPYPLSLEALLAGALPPALYRCSTRTRAVRIKGLAAAYGWRVYWLDGRCVDSKAAFLAQAAAALRFPGYFGHNWDAFEECINDMSWEPQQPALLFFDYPGRFAAAQPDQFATALDILAAAAEGRRGSPRPLIVLLRGAGRAAGSVPAVRDTSD